MLLTMVLFQLIEAPDLRYQRDWFESREWWRLLTAHWVHVNWVHCLLNAAGLVLCLWIASPQWSISRWFVFQLLLSLGISLLFSFLNSELEWYVGYSGVLYGIFMLAAFDLYHRDKVVSVMLILSIVIKITIEQSSELDFTTSDIIGSPVIVDAHLYGMLLAVSIALVNRLYTMVRALNSVETNESK